MKSTWNLLSCAMIMYVVQFWKKVIKRRGQDWISALHLYMKFSKLSWYKSETLRILSNLKILLALDVLLLKVMYFTIRFCSTCTGRITVLYARPQSIMQYCKCEWKRLKQIKHRIFMSAKCLILHTTPQAWESFLQRLLIYGFHESLLPIYNTKILDTVSLLLLSILL